MSPYNKNSRDEVLLAFHRAYDRPTAEQIIEWVSKHPEFAEDIRAHAAVAHDWAAVCEAPATEPDETMLQRAFSNALNAMYDADREAEATSDVASEGFHDILARSGKEIFELASEFDIARGVLAALFNGWMLPPIRARLVSAVMSALAITRVKFDCALAFALLNPRLGHAKANQAPGIQPRACDDIIRDSPMSPERKRYWLEQDQ
ncbi:hypothetical protein [Reyranella sp.]|uniref:hypothetical protein n=1 Tax=Reyranella sp. TaxID=1929291 RepID=UPI0011FFE91E|nr:hypothetical protein [Reyranella sp.]TAJ81849.1 MAG: hypothetical protein EPO50_29015 [Reyranella sp.]